MNEEINREEHSFCRAGSDSGHLLCCSHRPVSLCSSKRQVVEVLSGMNNDIKDIYGQITEMDLVLNQD